MGWPSRSWCAAAVLALLPLAHCWSTATPSNLVAAGVGVAARSQQRNEVSPYIDLVLCPIRHEPWNCARQQSARILDVWDSELVSQWQKLKVEADRQLNSTIEKRGYSASEDLTKEKPSTILKKIEIGTKFMKEYLAETMDGFLGREYGYMQNTKQHSDVNEEDDDDDEEENDDSVDHAENESEDDALATEQSEDGDGDENAKDTAAAAEASNIADTSNGIEFIEIEESAPSNGQLKKGSGGGGGNKRKKKPTNVLVVQPIEQHDVHAHGGGHGGGGHGGGGHGGGGHGGGGHGGRPLKQKRKKRKKHPPVEDIPTVVIEQEPSHHLGLGLLDELVGAVDVGGGKRKHKPSKYGRSNGVTRGKKKKKKKALQKLILLGTFLKAKIELLLKILGAHLQIKFFAIALIGLLINIARFWIDVKRGGVPQKVIYVEHAHHQHHYEDHGGDDWGEQGSYWKRSLQTDPTVEEAGYGATDSYQPVSQPQPDAHHMAYRNQWQ